jgi:uncharacterized integral membrane protein
MEWKIIFFVIILGLALAFVGLNLNNKSDISIGFYVWREVPVFFTAFFSFALGVLSMIPFLFKRRFQSKKKRERVEAAARAEKGETGQTAAEEPEEPEDLEI